MTPTEPHDVATAQRRLLEAAATIGADLDDPGERLHEAGRVAVMAHDVAQMALSQGEPTLSALLDRLGSLICDVGLERFELDCANIDGVI